jgi:hypothetical protein
VGNAHIAVLPRAPTLLELTPGTTHQPGDNDSSNSSRDLASLVLAISRSVLPDSFVFGAVIGTAV